MKFTNLELIMDNKLFKATIKKIITSKAENVRIQQNILVVKEIQDGNR